MRTKDEIKADIALCKSALTDPDIRQEQREFYEYREEQAENNMRLFLTEGIPMDELENISTAWGEGRCLIAPCGLGAPVYMKRGKSFRQSTVASHVIDKERPGFWTDDDHFFHWDSIGDLVFLSPEAAKAALARKEQG